MRNPLDIVAALFRSSADAPARIEPTLKPTAELATEQAGPISSFVRNPFGHHPAAGLTPERLAFILRSSIEGFPERYLELAEDMEERFPQYASVLSTRKRAVASLDMTVVPAGEEEADKAEAELVREVIRSSAFSLSRIDQLDAIGKSFSCTEMIWQRSATVWKPTKFLFRDPRFFEFDRVDPEHIMLRGEGGLEELKPNGWIVHRAKAKSGLTIRGGVARQAAWLFLFASFNLKDWAVFAEAFGMPLKVGKYGPDATTDDIQTLLMALRNFAVDGAAAIPESMSVDFVHAQISGSVDLFEKRANHIDQQISKIVLGQTGTTDVIKGGGYASSKVHDEVRDDIADADAEQWAATLNEQLVQPLINFNFPARARNGFPEIKIGRPEEEDVKALVENVARLVPLGLKVSMSEMQAKIGVTAPLPDEELLHPSAKVPEKAGEEPAEEPGANAASVRVGNDQDSIDAAIATILDEDGWEPLVAGMADDIRARLKGAQSVEEAQAILAAAFANMDVSALTNTLANAMFAARLAGEVGEEL